jgi:hypothetical protein
VPTPPKVGRPCNAEMSPTPAFGNASLHGAAL